jgi:anti-sigma factor RsiW
MKMKELEKEEYLSGYLDGELTKQEASNLKDHIEICDACSALLGELGRLVEEVRKIKIDMTAEEVKQIGSNIERRIVLPSS